MQPTENFWITTILSQKWTFKKGDGSFSSGDKVTLFRLKNISKKDKKIEFNLDKIIF